MEFNNINVMLVERIFQEVIGTIEKEKLKFIIPLPRNSALIDYQKIKVGNKSLFDGHFQYEGAIFGIIQHCILDMCSHCILDPRSHCILNLIQDLQQSHYCVPIV